MCLVTRRNGTAATEYMHIDTADKRRNNITTRAFNATKGSLVDPFFFFFVDRHQEKKKPRTVVEVVCAPRYERSRKR